MTRLAPTSVPFLTCVIAASFILFCHQADAVRLIEESFENFDSNNDPVGWNTAGHPNYIQVQHESVWDVDTSYGEYVVSTYGGSGAPLSRIVGVIPNDFDDDAGGAGDYIVKFNIANRSGSAIGEYRAEIWVIPFFGPAFQVASVAGDTDGSKDFSYSNQISWRYEYQDWVDAEGGFNMIAGAQIEIRLMQDPDRSNWRHTPLWDNVTVDYEPDIDSDGPIVVDITDDNEGVSVVATNSIVTYTVFFDEAVDPTSVDATDFENAGSATAAIESVTLNSDNTSVVVEIIPSSAGTLRLGIVQDSEIADANGNLMDTSSETIQDNVTFTVVAGIPTILPSDFVDDQGGGPIEEDTLVTYTLTFSKDMDATTVASADFENGGTSTITFGNITEITDGVFEIEVTPVTSGTLQFQIKQGVNIESADNEQLNTSEAIADDTIIIVDSTPPIVTDIVDEAGGNPVAVGSLLTYEVYFSEDMNSSTITAADFGNSTTTGAATYTIDSVEEATPGTIRIEITPTGAGTIQLQINAGTDLRDASGNALDTTLAITDDVTITIEAANTDPYDTWSGGTAPFGDDANGDTIPNGLAWLLGATDENENALSHLPQASVNASGDLILTFRVLKTANRGTAVAKVQYSNDMGATDLWADNEAEVPDTDSTVNGIVFDTTDDGDFINVTATIPASAAGSGGKLFARFVGEMP